ncbi:MAG: hypothetical protein AABZ60_22935 [Planctomycetota bacterium]
MMKKFTLFFLVVAIFFATLQTVEARDNRVREKARKAGHTQWYYLYVAILKYPVTAVGYVISNLPTLVIAIGTFGFDALSLFRAGATGHEHYAIVGRWYIPWSTVYDNMLPW